MDASEAKLGSWAGKSVGTWETLAGASVDTLEVRLGSWEALEGKLVDILEDEWLGSWEVSEGGRALAVILANDALEGLELVDEGHSWVVLPEMELHKMAVEVCRQTVLVDTRIHLEGVAWGGRGDGSVEEEGEPCDGGVVACDGGHAVEAETN